MMKVLVFIAATKEVGYTLNDDSIEDGMLDGLDNIESLEDPIENGLLEDLDNSFET